MNDFAKAQLMKYGWSEGKGLGKHESGITQALKPKLKFDTAGIGHRDKDWNNWWENAYNKAADNITVDSHTHSVSISLSKERESDHCLKEASNKKKSKYSTNYGNFLKTSTLHNGKVIEETNANLSQKQNAEENVTFIPLTDEELFKVCGGRTAHKGARHGLTLNGKLKRIAQQEQELLSKNSSVDALRKMQSNSIELGSDETETISAENTITSITSIEEVPVRKESKTTRKRNKRRMNDLTHKLNVLCNISDSDEKSGRAIRKEEEKQKEEKHRKRRRRKEKRTSSISYDIESTEKEEADNESKGTSFPVSQKSGEQLTEKNNSEQSSDLIDKEFDNMSVCTRKKRKKKKHQDNQYEIISDKSRDKELHASQAKKIKRSHNSDSAVQLLINNEEIESLHHQFQKVFSCNELPEESHQIRDSSVSATESLTEMAETYPMNKAHHLNFRIKKKKESKLRKKEKVKLCKITDSLKAVHLNTKEPTKEKSTKEILRTVVDKLMTTDITKKKTSKGKKNKQTT